MALQTSLTFGFDLTQFIPSGFIRDTTIELAKRLRRGGSDLVAENELNLFLGRALLADATAKSFRYYMTRNENRYEHLCGQIGLMIGPGPTVQQAIVEGIRSSRFSMIVQCRPSQNEIASAYTFRFNLSSHLLLRMFALTS